MSTNIREKSSILINGPKARYQLFYSVEYNERTKIWHLIIHYSKTSNALYSFYKKTDALSYLSNLKTFLDVV